MSGPGSTCSVSGLQGTKLGALEKWWWLGFWFFFSQKLKSRIQPLGASDWLMQRMNSEQSELVAVKDVSMLSEASESHYFCHLQTWGDGIAVVGPWVCLIGAREMLMSDRSWMDAFVNACFCEDRELWSCMGEKIAPGTSGLEAGQCPMNIHSCLLNFPRMCQNLLTESQMTDVIKFLYESAHMGVQGFFIMKHHPSSLSSLLAHPTHLPGMWLIFGALGSFFASVLSSIMLFSCST